MHYLEQLPTSIVTSWEHLGSNKKNGISNVTDMRYGDTLLFYNEKKYNIKHIILYNTI